MYSRTLLYAFALAALSPLSEGSAPDITFLCNEMPNICTNMCWAVKCARPPASQQLTLDFPSDEARQKRLELAGCGPNNRCSHNGTGQVGHLGAPNTACNSYPLAITKESKFPDGHQVSRCVPETEQQKQNEDIAVLMERFLREYGKEERKFSINFGNPGSPGVKYCSYDPCGNDELQMQKATINKRGEGRPQFRFYKLKSNMTIATFQEMTRSQDVIRRISANEVAPIELENWTEKIDGNSVEMMQDVVVKEISAEDFSKEAK